MWSIFITSGFYIFIGKTYLTRFLEAKFANCNNENHGSLRTVKADTMVVSCHHVLFSWFSIVHCSITVVF